MEIRDIKQNRIEPEAEFAPLFFLGRGAVLVESIASSPSPAATASAKEAGGNFTFLAAFCELLLPPALVMPRFTAAAVAAAGDAFHALRANSCAECEVESW